MRFFRYFAFSLLLFTFFSLSGNVVFSADDCVKESELVCYKVLKVEGISVTFNSLPPGIQLSTSEGLSFATMNEFARSTSLVCLVPKNKIPKNITDDDSYGRCMEEASSASYGSLKYYKCWLGNNFNTITSPNFYTCNWYEVEKKIAEEQKAQRVAEGTEYGTGNVTCGGRTFNCVRGGWLGDVSNECFCCGQCKPDDLLVVGNTILKWLFGIVGAIGLLMFIWGGFNWVISGGEQGRVTEGKKAITNTVIGLVIMFSAGVVVLTIQEKLGLDVKISVVGELSNSGSSSSQGATGSGNEIHGTLQLGEKCTVQEKTTNSDCAAEMYCYAVKDNPETKGICLPKNPKGSSKPGYRCWILNDGNTCSIGDCLVLIEPSVDPGTPKKAIPGTEGVCTSEDDINGIIGKVCSADTECGSGFKCTNKKCVMVAGRNMDRREPCYILPGSSSNDCGTNLKCFPDLNNTKASRTIGSIGYCAYNQSLIEGKICIGNVECKTGLVCKRIPKAATEICVSSTRKFDVELGKSCFKFTMEGSSTTDEWKNVIDNCVSGLECFYGKDSDKSGVCVPSSPVGSVSEIGGVCYILPGSSSMCANDLQCVSYISKTYKTSVGSKGICIPKYNSVDVSQVCVYLPGSKTVCKSGLTCDVGMLSKEFGRQGLCVQR